MDGYIKDCKNPEGRRVILIKKMMRLVFSVPHLKAIFWAFLTNLQYLMIDGDIKQNLEQYTIREAMQYFCKNNQFFFSTEIPKTLCYNSS